MHSQDKYTEIHFSKRWLLIVTGWISLTLGILGIFLPLLPTTPFVLLSSWCFARSSKRFHQLLVSNRFLGPIITEWEAGRGISLKVRNRALITLWITLAISMLIVGKWWSVLLLSSIGTGTTIYLCRLARKAKSEQL
ncbi:YbaN family protein [Sessilibacter sp. MAH2]